MHQSIRTKTVILIIIFTILFSMVALAAPANVEKIKYIYFLSGTELVKINYVQAMDARKAGNSILFDSVNNYVTNMEMSGSAIVFETDTGKFLDYQKALGAGKINFLEIKDDPLFVTIQPVYTKELKLLDGTVKIMPADITPKVTK